MESLELQNGRVLKFNRDGDFRGWDAADEYILEQDIKADNILIIEDSNGALSCGIDGNLTTYTSSILNKKKIEDNLELNRLKASIISDFSSLPDNIDLVVIKLPKFIDLFEYFLQVIGSRYPGVRIIAGGMVKYMPITMVRLCEEYFDNVTTSLAKKKARLIFATASDRKTEITEYPKSYVLDNGLKVVSYPGVFSGDHLDIGTRFLLDYVPSDIRGTIVDLGCASGVLGLVAKNKNPDAEVILTDESFLAVVSAKESFKANNLTGSFLAMDILKDIESDSVDLILCNPPFHQGNRVLTDIAVEMFTQSKRVLKKGGRLMIVANRHLGYHKKLRTIYHNLNRVAQNDKFNIFSVRKV